MSIPTRRQGITALAAVLILAACAETGDAYYASIRIDNYPKADGPGEVMSDGEAESARRIAAIIEAHLVRLKSDYHETHLYRDAHPKATGCVDASFTINADIPPALRHGLFATPGRSFPAIVRFSNSNENPFRADSQPDGRGMAIKLFGLRPDEHPMTADPQASRAVTLAGAEPGNFSLAGQPAQDLIMISHPTFLVADAEGYRRMIGYADADNWMADLAAPVAALFAAGIPGIKSATETTSLTIDNPLSTRYWSMVPYQLGNSAVKFSVRLESLPQPQAVPDKSDPNFLTRVMSETLKKDGTRMTFLIQPRTSDTQSVEDSRIEWLEQDAPFYPVATITIPAQTFDTEGRRQACEALSYSPWHALQEHKPLGAVNRMRKAIYEAISAFRREG